MKMGDTCKNCRSWEEEIFWTHFQTVHFSQFLHAGFNHQLPMPEKFATNFKKKLPEIVTLKGPSGDTWNVGLTEKDDALFFDHGWENFVKDHFLEENDFLVFKYNGVTHFDVLIFDGQSMCEKASSYFVRKCGHGEHESGYNIKTKMPLSSVDIIHTPSAVEGTPRKATNIQNDTPPREPIILGASNKRMRSGNNSVRDPYNRQRGRHESDDFLEDVEIKPDIANLSLSRKLCDSPEFLSKRRPVTEDEKRNALHLAEAATTDEGFFVVMRPTCVYKKFFMSIPSSWVIRNLSLENQDVILRTNGNMWYARFSCYKPRHSGGLLAGWKKFVLDNHLDEFDVCVFEPVRLGSNPIVLDVRIFRVVQAAIPSSQVRPD
ncbi:B3 domain-containing protein REM16-like isoform X1 [Carica papaya]|uniref:B3 domain-containing protein REM16-like isoform X1 n=2 Tax=Carica papaya TaxID=3649 RepID=UPI000B8C9918|nr:B3 domain-containing protein REM16-like isoform X1 [Carica papaya]